MMMILMCRPKVFLITFCKKSKTQKNQKCRKKIEKFVPGTPIGNPLLEVGVGDSLIQCAVGTGPGYSKTGKYLPTH
jgi:hypothetical protein